MDLVVKGKFPAPVDQGAVGREWAGRGYDCRLFVDPPGREWNGFVHATNELVTVVEGALLCTVEIGTVEIGTVEINTVEIGTVEIGTVEIDTVEIDTVEIGTVEINAVEKKTIRLEMGDELFIPRHAVHSVKNIHTGTTRWLFGYD